MLRLRIIVVLCLLVSACSHQPARESAARSYQGSMPSDLSGFWQRDYWRGDDVNRELDLWFRRLSRTSPDQRLIGYPGLDNSGGFISSGYVSEILALARLADEITRLRYFSISQTENEITVERENDFDISCRFSDGVARGVTTSFGAEICGWSDKQFVSRLILPDGLLVNHRFTVAPDSQNLHISTTVSSSTTGLSFSLGRFYTKYQPFPSQFDCIDTLSRNRVCTMGEDSP